MKKLFKMDSNRVNPSNCQASTLTIEPCLLGWVGLIHARNTAATCVWPASHFYCLRWEGANSHAWIAQWSNWLLFDLEVVGSNPARGMPRTYFSPPQDKLYIHPIAPKLWQKITPDPLSHRPNKLDLTVNGRTGRGRYVNTPSRTSATSKWKVSFPSLPIVLAYCTTLVNDICVGVWDQPYWQNDLVYYTCEDPVNDGVVMNPKLRGADGGQVNKINYFTFWNHIILLTFSVIGIAFFCHKHFALLWFCYLPKAVCHF